MVICCTCRLARLYLNACTEHLSQMKKSIGLLVIGERGEPKYISEIVDGLTDEDPFLKLDGDDDTEVDDALYDEAVQFVLESRRASISSVQRKLRIGYNRAARLIEAMELAGVVSPMNSNGSREIMVPKRD